MAGIYSPASILLVLRNQTFISKRETGQSSPTCRWYTAVASGSASLGPGLLSVEEDIAPVLGLWELHPWIIPHAQFELCVNSMVPQ